MTPDRTQAVRELLTFYVEAGVDAVVGENPIDRFGRPAFAASELSSSSSQKLDASPPLVRRPEDLFLGSPPSLLAKPRPNPIAVTVPAPEAAVMAAREGARSAANLDELRAILDRFDGCALKQTATQLVFADGNPKGRVMFVGEAPGRDEDIEGLPFVGRSGKLLDRMMTAIGLDRTSAYIANIIPWRPPGNRTPTQQEAAICFPFLLRQIELADPDVLVCLGSPSAQALLGVKDGILKTRGRWFTFDTGSREIRAIATLHPAYLLRQPLQKRLAWRDFLAIKKALAGSQA